MTTKYVNDGNIVHHVLTKSRVSGEFDLVGDQLVVFLSSGDEGDLVAVARAGRFRDAPKKPASDLSEIWSQFQKLYWDNTAKRFTLDDNTNANRAFAVAAKAAADGDDFAEVILINPVA